MDMLKILQNSPIFRLPLSDELAFINLYALCYTNFVCGEETCTWLGGPRQFRCLPIQPCLLLRKTGWSSSAQHLDQLQ